MEIVVLPDRQAIGALGADAVANLLQRKPDAVLGLATGSSPLAIYDELAARCAAGSVTLGRARGFTLDEYVGLPADHPETYRNVIDRHFVSRVDFAPGAVRGPDGLAADIPKFSTPSTSPPWPRPAASTCSSERHDDLLLVGRWNDLRVN